jgi:ribosomal protein L37AE/L43A
VRRRRAAGFAAGAAPTVSGMADSCRTAEQCPACGQADLRPYGNGSKWICPKCYFLLPCCEGGEQAGSR